jgi:hypothetical protein
MDAMLKPDLSRMIRAIGLVLTVAVSAHAQARVKVLDVYANSNAPETVALQIVSIKVDGRPIALGQPFTSGETWLKTLTIRVKNISGKTINSLYIGLGFGFPEFGKDVRGDVAFSLMAGIYGKEYDGLVASEKGKPVLPDEEIDLALTEKQLSMIQQMMAATGMTALDRVKFMPVTFVTFADGSRARVGFSYSK